MIAKILKIVFLIILILSFSCEEQGLFIKCNDCFADEPLVTDLEVKLDIGLFGAPILINVYEGNLEDGILYDSFSASGTTTKVNVHLNKKYTVTATYYKSEDLYVAVDSATPRVKYTKEQCDDPCYFVYDKTIDLRLKKTY
jgi:hypothetical protein